MGSSSRSRSSALLILLLIAGCGALGREGCAVFTTEGRGLVEREAIRRTRQEAWRDAADALVGYSTKK